MSDLTSLVNIEACAEVLPPALAKALTNISPIFLEKSPEEIIPEPNIRWVGVRQNLWKNIAKAQSEPGHKIKVADILGKFLSHERFNELLRTNEAFVAWLANPPLDERAFLDAALEIGHLKLLEILKIPVYKVQHDRSGAFLMDENGEPIKAPDMKSAKLIVDVFTILDKRKHGEYTQKILQKGQVEHMHGKVDDKEEKEVPSMADIDARIAQLEGDDTKQLTDENST